MREYLQQVAMDFLRPSILRWVPPADVMHLPPADFQDCHIVMQGETVVVACGAETAAFSLKKLWVQIEKASFRQSWMYPATPRDLAKLLIHSSVEHHEDIHTLALSYQGMGWYGYSVGIGGYIRKNGKRKVIDCWHIVVDEFAGDTCACVFDLREVYQEIERELKQGFTIEQPRLF